MRECGGIGGGDLSATVRRWRVRPATRAGLAATLAIAIAAGLGDRAADAQDMPYTVEIVGLDAAPELAGLIRDAAATYRLREQPAPGEAGLRRRAEADRDVAVKALRSLGYYDGVVAIDVDGSVAPALVTIAVEPGPRYAFDRVGVVRADGVPWSIPVPTPDELGLSEGEPAVARAVVGAEPRIVGRLSGEGYPYATVPRRRAVVDHDRRTMDVGFDVEPGPRVRMGGAVIEGLDGVDARLVTGRLGWSPGDVHDPAKLDRTRKLLRELDVFSSTALSIPRDPPDADADGDATVPVQVTVSEQPRRFIGAGLEYTTSEGFGGTAFWGHRNLFGGAEQLRVTAEVRNLYAGSQSGAADLDRLSNRLGVQFRKPDVFVIRQSLVIEADAAVERPAGYDREGLTLVARLERHVTDRLSFTYGVLSDVSRTQRDGQSATDFFLLGLPLGLSYDASNDLLDPTAGYRGFLSATPFHNLRTEATFLQTRATATAYADLTGTGRIVLAGRGSVAGTVGGDGADDNPANRLFYVGGGGSLRGYAYQRAGRLAASDDPIPGRSLVELSAELRIKLTESFGVVPFLDAGSVQSTDFPSFSEPLRYGAGVGLRYYTDFGPIRFDVAFPLDRREADDLFELYISIGQAF
jgi:translocation and assembly module TamA